MSRKPNRRSLLLCSILGLLVIALCSWGYRSLGQSLRNHGDLYRSKDQLHQLLALMAKQQASMTGPEIVAQPGAAGLYGKNVVLSLVASGRLDPGDPEQLGLLFRRRVVPAGIDASSYEGITMEALRVRRFPHLTDILGPTASAARHPNAADSSETGRPIIALALPWGSVLVGTSSGQVRCLEGDDLDLEGGGVTDSGVRVPAWLSDE